MKCSFFLRASGIAAFSAAFFAACFLGPVAAHAASPVKRAAAEEARVVELFDGIKSGDIEVKVIPKDAKEGTVTIRNKTGRLLAIKVPEALAACPCSPKLDGVRVAAMDWAMDLETATPTTPTRALAAA